MSTCNMTIIVVQLTASDKCNVRHMCLHILYYTDEKIKSHYCGYSLMLSDVRKNYTEQSSIYIRLYSIRTIWIEVLKVIVLYIL